MTWADKIRGMSDKQLAVLMAILRASPARLRTESRTSVGTPALLKHLDWLKSEIDEV